MPFYAAVIADDAFHNISPLLMRYVGRFSRFADFRHD